MAFTGQRRVYFQLPADLDSAALADIFGTKELAENGSWNRRETYYDTFGWMLHERATLLKKRGKKLFLCDGGGRSVAQAEASPGKNFFAWDIDDRIFAEELRKVSGIRALTEVCAVRSRLTPFSVLNRDRKTVVRLRRDCLSILEKNEERMLPCLLSVEEVRGYGDEFEAAVALLRGSNLSEYPFQSTLHYILDTDGRVVRYYSSKFSIDLDRQVSVFTGFQRIALSLVEAMNENIGGVIHDIDSEFLHDYRIAVRRTRSLLSQMKKAVAAEDLLFFKDEFKWLGTLTGPVRDIDVYLLKRDDYREMLPEELHGGLEDFFADLEAQRKKQLELMIEGLRSERYLTLMKRWNEFLADETGEETWPMGNRKCVEVAVRMIRKRMKKILVDGGRISDSSPDEELHRLRIEGKKLRYMLEFYRSFFSKEEVEFFLKQMKKLQNNLGDFNDLSVQQEMLASCKRKLGGRNRRSIGIAAAIGGLLAHLNEEHRKVRQKFGSTFETFASQENIQRFETLIHSLKDSKETGRI